VDQPFVSLCLLRRPVEFDAIDHKPVHAVFLVVSPSVPSHLKILAQLGFILRDQELRGLLARRAATSEILSHIKEIEQRSTGSYPAPGTVRR
jgi:PTS system nitrogen regulatory IIA component